MNKVLADWFYYLPRTLLVVIGWLLANLPAQAGERVALVIGNSDYRNAPLTNPRNDANAMAELLAHAGFQVDKQLDSNLHQMEAAVARFGLAIRDPGVKFGLFYYAGHAFQQDWRNYLVPVSANILAAAEAPKQTVDVSNLFRYMEQSQGRSFLIILDACRDDPFSGAFRPIAKGLSQFDAPVGSLLAYATAPGNVAQDGEGKNGLYTSFLLREFAVPGARLEDAFKRVRLSVRLSSKGAQVPWESTSLEEDIYFFPRLSRELSEADKDQLLEKEMSKWLRVKNSQDPEVLADFIREYPSGSASELAQSRMNRMLSAIAAREDQRLQVMAQGAARAAQELLALEQEARRRAAQAEQERVAAQRAQEERMRLARLDAARDEARRQQIAEDAAQRTAAGLEVTRQNQLQALAQAAELQRMQALRDQKEVEQRALALQAEETRLEFVRLAAMQLQEATRLAAERQSLLGLTSSVPVPVTLTPTPFFKGYAEHQRHYSPGDEFNIRVIDLFSNIPKPLVMKVTQVDLEAERVTYNDGKFVSDLMGNTTTNERGVLSTPRQFYPAELMIGKKWRTRFKQSRPSGATHTFQYDLKVVAKERITVPAGTFETYKIEAHGFNLELGARIERTIWVAPGINADIAHEIRVRLRNGSIDQNERQELVSFVQAARS